MSSAEVTQLRRVVRSVVQEVPVTDIHTHLYPPDFGRLLLWGIDELLTYHYLVAETFRYADRALRPSTGSGRPEHAEGRGFGPLQTGRRCGKWSYERGGSTPKEAAPPYDKFWALPKQAQADFIWKTLFLDASPISEACRGVLTVLKKLGLDVRSRDLPSYRRFFGAKTVSEYVDEVLALSRVETVVMTNDPFNDEERVLWLEGGQEDGRFRAALRLDALLNAWESAWPRLREWGYRVERRLTAKSLAEVRRFLAEWAERMGVLYCAVSLPPSFRFPEKSARSTLLRECVLPVCAERNLPLALMMGVKKRTNPALGDAGDSVGKGDIDTVEHLCAEYPRNKFLVTMLSRENQHELCVAARKFPNLLVFGCWWFLNNPSLVEEVTRMRLELLGLSVIPQHSDARVLDQLIYKWEHAKAVITEVLLDKYTDLLATGWRLSEEELRRDVARLFGGNFWAFLGKKLG